MFDEMPGVSTNIAKTVLYSLVALLLTIGSSPVDAGVLGLIEGRATIRVAAGQRQEGKQV